jgi:hypothetical protein
MYTPNENPDEYKALVEKIRNLNWKNLPSRELKDLMVLSYAAALEFAESLRIALDLYPEDENLQEMAKGELDASNLSFEDFDMRGDHSAFLYHFICRYNYSPSSAAVLECAREYFAACRQLPPEVRAMSVFSREAELPGIFEEILKADDWDDPMLAAFRYYLETHIDLDSDEGGHNDLLSDFIIDDSVLPFYEARLKLYDCIESLK